MCCLVCGSLLQRLLVAQDQRVLGTFMKSSTRAERWWDFSPRKSTVIKTSQHISQAPWSCHSTFHHPPWMPVPQLLRHPQPSWFPGCRPLNRSWAPVWHPWCRRRRAGWAWEQRTAGRPVRPRRSRHTAQPWNTSGRLESCWQSGGNWESWARNWQNPNHVNYGRINLLPIFRPTDLHPKLLRTCNIPRHV